jgi:hypothetical protein
MKSQHIKEVLYIAGIVHINLSKIRVKVKAARKKKKKLHQLNASAFS